MVTLINDGSISKTDFLIVKTDHSHSRAAIAIMFKLSRSVFGPMGAKNL